jgi:uncharacterized protein YfbU (UPF0304 family)
MKSQEEELKEFKVKTTLMKSQEEELKEFKKMIEAWEATKRKWAKTLGVYMVQCTQKGGTI